jgi:glucose 1-dehydrogenase
MRVLVTGASPGIGGATCLRLAHDAAARGEKLRIAASELRQTPSLGGLVAKLEALDAEVITPLGDLHEPDTPARLIDETAIAFGGLDAVVSNAGITGPAPLLELSLELWDSLFDVNVRAAWLLAKAAHPALKDSNGGFVAVASMSGMLPHKGMGAYSPSKAAVIMLVRQLAQEWAADGIRVNCVSPGMVQTPLTQPMYDMPDVAKARNELVPMQRVAQPDDMAAVIAMLLGPDARYITGQNILADGGFTETILDYIPGKPASTPGI